MNDTISYRNRHRFVGAMHDFDNCEECDKPQISKARYSKRMYSVSCPSNDGYKSYAARKADTITERYSHREKSYIMSRAQVNRFIVALLPMTPVFVNLDENEFD